MLKKTLLFAAASFGISGAALAKPPHWAPAHGYRAHQHYQQHYRPHYRPYYAARPVYVAPRPVYVVPAPRVVYAPPAAVYPPAPVYGAPSVSIRLNLPL